MPQGNEHGMLRVPVLVLLLTEKQDGEIGGGFAATAAT